MLKFGYPVVLVLLAPELNPNVLPSPPLVAADPDEPVAVLVAVLAVDPKPVAPVPEFPVVAPSPLVPVPEVPVPVPVPVPKRPAKPPRVTVTPF